MASSLPIREPGSSPQGNFDVSRLAVVTVTYQPDCALLKAQLSSLPESALKIVVDNHSGNDARAMLREICDAKSRIVLVENEANQGLPAAINRGVRLALQLLPDCSYLLLLDQDTQPCDKGVLQLLEWYERLRHLGSNPGCVGPMLADAVTGLKHGFHRIEGWRWVRRYPGPDDPPLECHNLNCSGTLLSAEIFMRLGGMEEDLFIDHLDTEWAFRVQAAGYRLYGIPTVSFRHQMGQTSWRIWMGGWRIWPYRSPARHFFLFRNAVRLMRRDYVPVVWKFWAIPKLALTVCVHLVLDPHRWRQLRSMTRGIWAGFQREGKVDNSSSRLL